MWSERGAKMQARNWALGAVAAGSVGSFFVGYYLVDAAMKFKGYPYPDYYAGSAWGLGFGVAVLFTLAAMYQFPRILGRVREVMTDITNSEPKT